MNVRMFATWIAAHEQMVSEYHDIAGEDERDEEEARPERGVGSYSAWYNQDGINVRWQIQELTITTDVKVGIGGQR